MSRKPNEIDKYIGDRLKARRIQLGLTIQDLAKATNVSHQQIAKYETGVNRTSASKLVRLSELLEVPMTYFVDSAESGSESEDYWAFPREGLELVKSYNKIQDAVMRKHIRDLVHKIANT